jgi:hypothetical protein
MRKLNLNVPNVNQRILNESSALLILQWEIALIPAINPAPQQGLARAAHVLLMKYPATPDKIIFFTQKHFSF